jgi:hypothetical protein
MVTAWTFPTHGKVTGVSPVARSKRARAAARAQRAAVNGGHGGPPPGPRRKRATATAGRGDQLHMQRRSRRSDVAAERDHSRGPALMRRRLLQRAEVTPSARAGRAELIGRVALPVRRRAQDRELDRNDWPTFFPVLTLAVSGSRGRTRPSPLCAGNPGALVMGLANVRYSRPMRVETYIGTVCTPLRSISGYLRQVIVTFRLDGWPPGGVNVTATPT